MPRRTGRNALCPCGSGKKFKRCHGSETSTDPFEGLPSTVVAAYIDRGSGQRIDFDGRVLWKHLHEEAPRIASSFDRLYATDIDEISREVSIVLALLAVGESNALRTPEDETQMRLSRLFANAVQSVMGAVLLLRAGYGLQPGILLRTVIEAVAVGFAVQTDSRSYEAFKTKRLDPTSAIGPAKKLFGGMVGRLYGELSKAHAHTGPAHEQTYGSDPAGEFVRGEITVIKAAISLLSLSSELVFWQSVTEPRYWKPVAGGGLRFRPDADDLAILRDFVNVRGPAAGGAVSRPVDPTVHLLDDAP